MKMFGIGLLAFIGVLVLTIFMTGFNLKMEAWVRPQEAKIDRATTEQSRSFITSQNEQMSSFLAEAARTNNAGQKRALVLSACGIANGMDPSKV
jgi:hypothetical protein